MNPLEIIDTYCPYCGENLVCEIDTSSAQHQQYVEDCHVCCAPIVFNVLVDMDTERVNVVARTENDC